MKYSRNLPNLQLPIAPATLIAATEKANAYLVRLPSVFKSQGAGFYAILNQRNLSGFIGEVLKHAIFSCDAAFTPNPHPDGRPDLLDLRGSDVRAYYNANCFDQISKGPLRDSLAPFKYGGVEIKCSIGKLKNASDREVGDSRVELVNGITYWAHHAHACDLLGVYYDYEVKHQGSPQIRALFYTKVLASDWHKVSIGNPDKKKTSNTSLNKLGISKLYQSLALYNDDPRYTRLLDRLRIAR